MKNFKGIKKNNEVQKQQDHTEKNERMLDISMNYINKSLEDIDSLEKEKKNMLPVTYLDASTMNIGLLSKPFYIMSENFYEKGDFERSDYSLLMSDTIASTNEYIINTIIAFHTRGFMLEYMNGIMAQLSYEFESLTKEQNDRLRNIAINFQDAIFRIYKGSINIDMIYKYAQVKYGPDKVSELLYSEDEDIRTLESFIDPIIFPLIKLCTKKIFATFLSVLYDAIYDFILFEGDREDYIRVTESIKDILYDFEDKLSYFLKNLTYILLMNRTGDSIRGKKFEEQLKQKDQ